jgi:hypothetical protein
VTATTIIGGNTTGGDATNFEENEMITTQGDHHHEATINNEDEGIAIHIHGKGVRKETITAAAATKVPIVVSAETVMAVDRVHRSRNRRENGKTISHGRHQTTQCWVGIKGLHPTYLF